MLDLRTPDGGGSRVQGSSMKGRRLPPPLPWVRPRAGSWTMAVGGLGECAQWFFGGGTLAMG